jgi:hypothetical protein
MQRLVTLSVGQPLMGYLDILCNSFVEYSGMSTGSRLLNSFHKTVRSEFCNRPPAAIAWNSNRQEHRKAFRQDQLSTGLGGRNGRRMHCSAFNKKYTNED